VHQKLCRSRDRSARRRHVPTNLPSDWFGDLEHTHKAIDDALGYANLLLTLARRAGAVPL
jgi:hypothetical protein